MCCMIFAVFVVRRCIICALMARRGVRFHDANNYLRCSGSSVGDFVTFFEREHVTAISCLWMACPACLPSDRGLHTLAKVLSNCSAD